MTPMNLNLCLCFGELLSYPDDRLKSVAADCLRQLKEQAPDARVPFEDYINFIELHDIHHIEEIFTATFDLQAFCHPYVGFQLCGESQARTMFLIKLKEIYAQHEFSCGTELPDHLGVMLRFIGSTTDPQGNAEIISDALLPALEKIIQGIEAQDHPYRSLLSALQIYLTNTIETELPEQQRQKELSHG